METRQYVQFPVAVEFVPQVTALLARLEADRAGGAPGAVEDGSGLVVEHRGGSAATIKQSTGRTWNQAQYNALARNDTVSAARVQKVLDALVEANGGRMSTSELVERTSVKDTEIRAALGWLSRWIRSQPEVFEDGEWPMGWAYGRQVDPQRPHEFHYELTPGQMHGWTEARRRNGL